MGLIARSTSLPGSRVETVYHKMCPMLQALERPREPCEWSHNHDTASSPVQSVVWGLPRLRMRARRSRHLKPEQAHPNHHICMQVF